MLMIKTNETPLDPFDLISDRRSVAALCLLYSSMVYTFYAVSVALKGFY